MELKEEDFPPKTQELETETIPIERLFLEIGLDKKEIGPQIIGRMKLLDKLTCFVADALAAIRYSDIIFNFYENTNSPFSDGEKQIVKIGMLFSDIGKTGPARANKRQQRLIAEMFAVENVRNTEMPVREFLKKYFPKDVEMRIKTFKELGLDSLMPIRDFWNLHTSWTLEIISGDGVPPEAVAVAATHQLLEDINPEDIVGTDGHFTKYFGENTNFDRPEKLLILLDKYEAFRRRLGKSHQETIARVRGIIAENKRYADDEEFTALLKNMETALADS